MTLSIYRNDTFLGDAGTNVGWGKLTRYIQRHTDVRRYPNAHHLVMFGWGRFARETTNELQDILQNHPPSNVATLRLLQEILSRLHGQEFGVNDTITVSDGLS